VRQRQVGCVGLAYATGNTHIVHLGAHTAESPLGALVWLGWRAAHIADQLDPAAAGPVRCWLADGGEHERAAARLGAGDPYFLWIHDGPDHYLLLATPNRAGADRVPVAHAPRRHRRHALTAAAEPAR
jgi:hypothetical protein